MAERIRALRQQVLEGYGPFCACCGETTAAFLVIDHVNGVPPEHRRPSGRRMRGAQLYRKLIADRFPPTCRVYCANCNHGREMNGGTCPHQTIGGAVA